MKKLLVLLCAALFLVACGGPSTEKTGEKKETAAAEKEKKNSDVVKGKTNVTVNDVNYKVVSTEFKKTVAGYTSEDNQYMIVKIKIKNNSKETFTANNSQFNVLIDGAEYENDATTTAYHDNGFFLEKINPGISKTASIVYEVPKNVKKKEMQLQIKPNSFKKETGLIELK